MEKSTLAFLGNDSGFGNRNTSAYIEENNELFIIDCGFTVFNEIKQRFDFTKYKKINIIITHLHNDHAGSLSQLILYLWFIYKIQANIISNCINLKQYLDITGTVPEAYILKKELDNVKFIKTDHVKYLDSYGIFLIFHDKKLLYTGDTCSLSSFLPYIDEIDEFYIDLSKYGGAHVKIDEVKDNLKEIKNKGIKVIPIHSDDKEYIEKIMNSL